MNVSRRECILEVQQNSQSVLSQISQLLPCWMTANLETEFYVIFLG